jgi:uncharacterized membrane protein YgdD (TMEM256/DUF423 family)
MTAAARSFALTAALLLALATVVGAFNAHALSSRLEPDQERIVQTAVQYQFYHALGLLGVALLIGREASAVSHGLGWLKAAGWLLSVGIVLFSGSLYALAGGVSGGLRTLVGVLTPVGGLSLILAWCAVATGVARSAITR